MAIWKDQASAPAAAPERAAAPAATPASTPAPAAPAADHAPAPAAPRTTVRAVERESVIAPELTIEGKIEGSGNVRIAGKSASSRATSTSTAT
ncbi:MAG: hypothetical protein MUF07_13530 [Steroidobacteraceae bacterium]|nr:hypothetical protein [Steroidobacteraceae bacterium]